jgi:hypothetical protein
MKTEAARSSEALAYIQQILWRHMSDVRAFNKATVELGYNVMKGTEYFVSL